MIHRSARMLFACAFFTTVFAACATADECKLGRIASLDFTDDGTIVIPVSIEGASVAMAIDTGAEASGVDPVVAQNLHLVESRIPEGRMYNTKGEQFTYIAVFHTFGMGDLRANDLKVLVWPFPLSGGGRIAGLLGSEVLRNYDVDIDFGAHKLSLFSQDHCPGKVVYWTSDNVAVVPIHILNSGHIIVPAAIDGHPVDALLDTGSSRSVLSTEFARNVFGLTPQSADMAKVGDMNGVVQIPVYKHTFKTLGLEGMTIGNPSLLIRDNLMKYGMTQGSHLGSRLSSSGVTTGQTDLTLGVNELRHLHLYIAYKEQKLYITPASAPVTVVAGGPANAASSSPAAAH